MVTEFVSVDSGLAYPGISASYCSQALVLRRIVAICLYRDECSTFSIQEILAKSICFCVNLLTGCAKVNIYINRPCNDVIRHDIQRFLNLYHKTVSFCKS